MREPNIFEGTSRSFAAAVGEDQAKALTSDGNFYRTLWHEVGHYLGVDRTRDGRDLDQALQDDASALEEMKADLVALFIAEALHKQGYYNNEVLKSVYAGGILRVLQNNKPRRDQPYQTMQLMQWNYFLENGLLTFENAKLQIHYEKYHSVVGKLLAKVLEVQYAGDKASAVSLYRSIHYLERRFARSGCQKHARSVALPLPFVQVRCARGVVAQALACEP